MDRTVTIEEHEIWADEIPPQTVWAPLAKLAWEVLKSYHTDLYHDAAWLQRHLSSEDGFTFYFAADDYGTAIGTDRDAVFAHRDDLHVTAKIVQHAHNRWITLRLAISRK